MRRERVIRLVVLSFILPFFTSILGPTTQSAYAAATCTGTKIIGVEYSKERLPTPEANLAWKRGTNTVLNQLLPTLLEWKRGTATALSMVSSAKLAINTFTVANPGVAIPDVQFFDDGYDTQTAVTKAKQWAADPCFMALIGPMQSYIAKAIIPIYGAAGIPILSPSASDPTLTTGASSTFHRLVLPEDPQDLRTINTLKELGITKPAIIEDNEYSEDQLSRWAQSPGLPAYSILEWKRGTPTVTVKTQMVLKAKAAGANGFLFNGMSNYRYVNYSDDFGDAWPIVGEFTEACPTCSGLVFGEHTNAAYIDYKYFDNTGVEGARILATSVPLWYANPNFAFTDTYYAEEGPYSSPTFDAVSFALEGIKAGNGSAQALNTFINTKKYNGISGPISFDGNGELAGRSQLVFTVTNGQRVLTSGWPSGYVGNGVISNYTAVTPTTTAVALQIKDFNEALTATRLDVHIGTLVKRYTVDSAGQISISLPNGTSYLSLTPDDESEIGIRRSQFEVVISNGIVTSFKNLSTGAPITYSSARFQVRIAAPTAIGTIASSISYEGQGVMWFSRQLPLASYSPKIIGKIRSDNKIYITTTPAYGGDVYFTAENKEDWSHRGTINLNLTSESLSTSGYSFTITPPLAKITGQVSGSFGPDSYAQVLQTYNGYSYSVGTSKLSSDGHFGFTGNNIKFPSVFVKVFAKTGSMTRAAAVTSNFALSALDTGTVTGLTVSLPANNVSGTASLDGVGLANTRFQVFAPSAKQPLFTSYTDNNGSFSIGLTQETYTINFLDNFPNRFQTTRITCVVTSSPSVCNAVLTPPTVVGKVSGFPTITYGHISFLSEVTPGKWGYLSKNAFAYLRSDGTFSGFISSGTYLMNLSLRAGGFTYGMPAGKCVVPVTGKVTCNISFTGGLKLKLKNNSGGDFTSLFGYTVTSLDTATAITSDKGTLRYSATDGLTIPLNNGKYSVVIDPHSNASDIGTMTEIQFEVVNNQVQSVFLVESQTSISPTNEIFTIKLAAPQVEGQVVNYDGSSVNYLSTVWIKNSSGTISRIGSSSNDGKFINSSTGKLADGQYEVWAMRANIKTAPNSIGLSSFETLHETFTIVSGKANKYLVLREQSPNVSGKLVGPNGPLANTYIDFFSLDMKKYGYYFPVSVKTDAAGNYSAYLLKGVNVVHVGSDWSRGFVSVSAECNLIETSTVCDLIAHAPNVTSKVTIAGKVYDFQYHYYRSLEPSGSSGTADEWWTDNHVLAGYLAPGKYRLEVGLYYRDAGGSTSTLQLLGPECVVPETGTVSCDAKYPSINLAYSIFDFKGTARIAASSRAELQLIVDSANQLKNQTINLNGTKNSQSAYQLALLDGSYRLRVIPNTQSATIGNPEVFLFDVIDGAVKNLRIEGTTQILTPVDGIYQLKLRSPALSGRVFTSGGTTPVANTEVRAILDGNQEFYANTDNEGYFSFDFESAVIDGTYAVSARARFGDDTQGESAATNVVVSGGASSGIDINLRAPNLSGLVSGPLGVSRNNWIYAYRVQPNGGTQWLRWGAQYTNQLGKFALWLEPGTYLLSSQDDMQGAGGTAARNVQCVVPVTGSVVCNLPLAAPNVRGTLTKNGIAQSGYIYIEKEDSNKNYFQGIDRYSYSGTNGWSVKLDPGTYRARAHVFNEESYYYSDTFTIVDTETVNIAFTVPEVNLRVQVLSASGVLQTNPTSDGATEIYIDKISDNKSYRASWKSNFMKFSGIAEVRLKDGTYTIWLQPRDSQNGTTRSYLAVVESGTVKSMRDVKTGAAVVLENGIYKLQLDQPGISGTVVAPNGTTPVPGAEVAYFIDGKICSWCERDFTSTGNNGYFAFGRVSDGQYQVYARPTDADITKGMSALSAVTVTNGQAAAGVTLALRDANVSGAIRGLPARFDFAYVQTYKVGENGQSSVPFGTSNIRVNSQGNFGLYLEPGTYRFVARIYSGGYSTLTTGYSQTCVVASSGSSLCDLTVNTNNLSVKIVAPGTQTLLSNTSIDIYAAQYDKNLVSTNPPISQNTSGAFTSFLENGTWRIQLWPNNSQLYTGNSYTVTVANGVVTKLVNDLGESLTAIDGSYLLSPKVTNLRGSVTFNGAPYQSQTYVRIQRNDNDNYYEITSRWSSGGQFGFSASAGKYRIVVDPYGNGSVNSPVITTAYNCVVPESGIATCDVALSTGNLSGRIVDETGALYRQAYINMWSIGADGRWDYVQTSVNEGIFRSNLADGKYQIVVVPYWEVRGKYTEHSYEITVAGNTVTQVRDVQKNETVTANSGSYSFVLGMPAIRGKLLAPGTSTLGISNVNIRVGQDRTARNWQYSTQTDTNGEFALTVPDGTYVIQATPFGSNFRYGKSETQTVVVTNGTIASQLTLRLREPNLIGRVVTPGANPVPVSGVNVNMWIGDEYFYTYTNSDGTFGAYVENANPGCPNKCSILLGYYDSTDYSSKNYTISSIGNLGDKALSGVSTRVTVLAPAAGAATTPNRYGYVSIEKWNPSLSQYEWQPGYHTNELGSAGLSLDAGSTYRLTANPGEGKYALFSPKVLVVESFSAVDSPTITMIFDRPNISLQVSNIAGAKNSNGFYQVSKYDSVSGKYLFFKYAYLDDQGKGALLLPQGNYTIHFWPGKINAGVEKEISISVDTATVVTGSSVVSGVATVTLPNGNISGYVRNQSSVGLNAVIITAVRNDDATKMVSTVTSTTGYYELNLDRTYAWTIKAIEPISTSTSQYALATASPANAATSSANISITVTP